MGSINRMLGIRYPLIQGAMAYIADHRLAAAVSNAGGLGIIASGMEDAEKIREEIRLCRKQTAQPFGVNIMLLSPHADALAAMLIEEKVPVVTTGAGSPAAYIPDWKKAGMKVIPVVASSAQAIRVERAGADAIVAEGQEAGGHIGELTTMALIPQVVEHLKIPVLAAGGIGDFRSVVAAFALGAKGVQVGTLFLASEECPVHENYKQMLLKARDSDTMVTGRQSGTAVRLLKNPMARSYSIMEKQNKSPEELEKVALGSLKKAVFEGDTEQGCFMAGQIAGLIKEIRPVREIIESLFLPAEAYREQLRIL